MADWLPSGLLAFVTIILAAIPWWRPDPNHEFMLDMLRLLKDEDSEASGSSSGTETPARSITQSSQLPIGHPHEKR